MEHWLTQRQQEIDAEYDFRYSVLPLVFANLLRDGRISADDLRGLGEDKLEVIALPRPSERRGVSIPIPNRFTMVQMYEKPVLSTGGFMRSAHYRRIPEMITLREPIFAASNPSKSFDIRVSGCVTVVVAVESVNWTI